MEVSSLLPIMTIDPSSSLSSIPTSPRTSAAVSTDPTSSTTSSAPIPDPEASSSNTGPEAISLASDDIEMDDAAEGEDGVNEEAGDEDDDDDLGADGARLDDSEGSDSDEEEDDEDDEDSGDESEDLEGSPDIIAVSGPGGAPDLQLPITMRTVKSEPQDPTNPTSSVPPTSPITENPGEPTNELIPKKKVKRRRSPSEDEDLPPPPPPMKTIRLERALPVGGADFETLEWNILGEAREKGMVAVWGEGEDVETKDPLASMGGGLIKDEKTAGTGIADILSGGDPFGGGDDIDAEEIARRLEEKYGDKPAKKSKKQIQRRKIDYDLEDPFIDDSELMIDAPTHYQRPEKEGFFVHSGPLKLLEASPIKPKTRTAPRPRAGPSNSAPDSRARPRQTLSSLVAASQKKSTSNATLALGSQTSPIKIDDDSDDDIVQAGGEAGPSRANGSTSQGKRESIVRMTPLPLNRNLYKNASKELDCLPPFPKLPVEIANRLMIIREAAELVIWSDDVKKKFPEHIKPLLIAAGRAAYEVDLFPVTSEAAKDTNFLDTLPSVLPYNKFTLSKLITKLCYEGFREWLVSCENLGLELLKEITDGDENGWVQKYEEAKTVWEQEMTEWNEKQATAPNGTAQNAPSQEPETIDVDTGDIDPTQASTTATDENAPREPVKRFPLTPEMRELFSQLLDNQQTMVDLNARMEEFKATPMIIGPSNEIIMRRDLYKKICECFPDGFMNSGILSREFSRLKKKAQAVDN